MEDAERHFAETEAEEPLEVEPFLQIPDRNGMGWARCWIQFLTFLIKAHSRALETWPLCTELTAELERLMAPLRTNEEPRPSRPEPLGDSEGAAERDRCVIQAVAERILQEALRRHCLAEVPKGSDIASTRYIGYRDICLLISRYPIYRQPLGVKNIAIFFNKYRDIVRENIAILPKNFTFFLKNIAIL